MTRVCHHLSIAALIVASLWPAASDLHAQRRATPSQIRDARAEFYGKAYNGEFNPNDYARAMEKLGVDPDDVQDDLDELREIADEAKAEGRDPSKDRNPGGSGNWDFGQVYRGQTYEATFPVTNNCRIPQVVEITYPTSIDLTGPTVIGVPAKSTVNVPVVLDVPDLNIPPGPIPLGTNFQCQAFAGQILMKHNETMQVQRTPAGKYTYICHASSSNYHVSMHAHVHDAPDPPGAGAPDKKNTTTCEIYWSTGEFTPDKDHLTPDSCREEIEELAVAMLAEEIAPLQKQHDASFFDWLPPNVDPSKLAGPGVLRAAVKQMSLDALLDLRREADNTVRSLGGSAATTLRAGGRQ